MEEIEKRVWTKGWERSIMGEEFVGVCVAGRSHCASRARGTVVFILSHPRKNEPRKRIKGQAP